ncbi:hypothetical protein NX779_01955 [Mycoplasma cottewii]|uniref:Lipoprotein n=1 Tax=Mycoplasma cottewii TaxID=51364 RepID=A0ABY5U0J6_9MOLU|nr:hypothetical protein [Mycoplasma cottewii]UWD35381.1 hypothetical protein NX779_01955 [Mycoplasma cottewii]
MKKFLKIMCLASLSVLSAGSIFGVIYHQHNSNLVKEKINQLVIKTLKINLKITIKIVTMLMMKLTKKMKKMMKN